MTILLSRIVPRAQLVAVHAPLGEVEWPGTIEHIKATVPKGVPLLLAPVASGKSLLERSRSAASGPRIQRAGAPATSRPDRSSGSCADTSRPIPVSAGGSSTPWACAPRKARLALGKRRGSATAE